jgi:hypothetical protein
MSQGTVGVAPATATFTLADGTTLALADWRDDKYYASGQLSNAQNQQLLIFIAGRSQPIPGGTRGQSRVDTNLKRGGESGLQKDFEMLVYGWGFKFVRAMRPVTGQTQPVLPDGNGALSDPLTLRTMFDLDRVIYNRYLYNNKEYTSGVPQDYPQGHGFNVFSTNTGFEIAQNGGASPRDRLALVIPVHEREQLDFAWELNPEAALIIAQAASDEGAPLGFVDVKIAKYGLIKVTVT